MKLLRTLSAWLAVSLPVAGFAAGLAGCASYEARGEDKAKTSAGQEKAPAAAPGKEKAAESAPPFNLDVSKRMSVGMPAARDAAEKAKEPVFSFRAQDMPIVDALSLFASAYGLNIVTDPEVDGAVTVDFKDLPFEKAMEAILDVNGYYWEWDKGLIRVRKLRTESFIVNYVRLIRGGTGRSQAQITSGQSNESGAIIVNQEDKVEFWKDLEAQLKEMISPEGKLVINQLAGAIQVTDLSQNVGRIEDFINRLNGAMHRQVEIEARIFEVTLNDESSLGVDWTRINLDNGFGSIVSPNIVTAPFGGRRALPSTMTMTYSRGDFGAIVSALKEQGEIRIVSQPKILTLNNQPALIKVGTDRPFFETTTTPVPGAEPTITEEVRYVTIGVVLSITPQISSDGWIMLDVSPIITRLVSTETSRYGSTAPVIDVKQSSTLVRLRDNEMVVIGGLIQDEINETERKVPLLGDIPGVGALFKGKYDVKVKRELAVFLTPRIIRD